MSSHLVNDTDERRLLVTHDAGGWNVIERRGSVILRHVRRRLWQGVEREIQRFETADGQLKRRGWIEYWSDGRRVSPS
jgi:hypothetical protein